MSTNSYNKNVYFYKTFTNPSFCINGKTETERLYNMFCTGFNSGCIAYEYPQKETMHHIQIISFDNEHIFGTYSKEETSPNPFIQFRNTVTNKIDPILPKTEPNKVLEYYTFFYVDFKNLMTAVIYNKLVGSLEKVFRGYFFNCSCNIVMIPYSIDNIKDAIRQFSSFSGIEYAYNEKVAATEFKKLSELNDFHMDIGSYKVALKIKDSKSELPEDICQHPMDKFASFKVYGQSNENIEQCFDTIKKSFMRRTQITLDNDIKNNLDKIENILSSEIVHIIGN